MSRRPRSRTAVPAVDELRQEMKRQAGAAAAAAEIFERRLREMGSRPKTSEKAPGRGRGRPAKSAQRTELDESVARMMRLALELLQALADHAGVKLPGGTRAAFLDAVAQRQQKSPKTIEDRLYPERRKRRARKRSK